MKKKCSTVKMSTFKSGVYESHLRKKRNDARFHVKIVIPMRKIEICKEICFGGKFSKLP